MSSDYIPRLRAELLRAGAQHQPRWRLVRVPLRPLVPVAAVALIVAALVVAWPAGREQESASPQTPTTEFAYRTDPVRAEEVAQILRARFAATGVDAQVTVSGGRLTITAPEGTRAEVTALTQPGRLAIYDWESSVLGPRGKPAPSDPAVTGGEDAGRGAAVSKAEAQVRGVRAGFARIVRAEGGAPNRWFALGGDPWMTNACVARARPATDQSSGDPVVAVDLTAEGRSVFSDLTRQVAQRGADREANQHLAIVIDDRIVAAPFIDYRQAPTGLDPVNGVQISGGFTTETARQTAALLSAGPLPAELSRQ
jgi:preprotein translocase subunit SecD